MIPAPVYNDIAHAIYNHYVIHLQYIESWYNDYIMITRRISAEGRVKP